MLEADSNKLREKGWWKCKKCGGWMSPLQSSCTFCINEDNWDID